MISFPLTIEWATEHRTSGRPLIITVHQSIKTNHRKQSLLRANCPLPHPFLIFSSQASCLWAVLSSLSGSAQTTVWTNRRWGAFSGRVSKWGLLERHTDLLYVWNGCNLYLSPQLFDRHSNQTSSSAHTLNFLWNKLSDSRVSVWAGGFE